jgi:hypothetical protein
MTLLQDAIAWLRSRGFELPTKPITLAYQLIRREKATMASKDKGPKATKAAQTEASRGPVGHWNDLPAPPELSDALNAVKVVIGKLRGTEADTVKAIYAGTVVLSFGAAQIPHDDHSPVFTSREVPADAEAAARELEGVLAIHADENSRAAVAPGLWLFVAQIVLPYLLEWIKNRNA